jgi:hypothetical protein
MSNVRENLVSAKSPDTKRASREPRRRPRTVAVQGAAFGLLAATLYFAPAALGQSQSAASSAPATQAAAQTSAPADAQANAGAQTKAPSQAQPQMQDQSAPPPQSLGEAARLARAQKPKSETTKVFTEDKLSGLSGHGVSSVGSGSAGAGSYGGNSNASSGASAGSGSVGSNEAYWRGRANGIRAQMAQLDAQIAGIRDEIKKKGAVTVDPMSGAAAGVIYVEDRNMQIRQIEAQKSKLQDQLEALAEEGRKAGADSGWFR